MTQNLSGNQVNGKAIRRTQPNLGIYHVIQTTEAAELTELPVSCYEYVAAMRNNKEKLLGK